MADDTIECPCGERGTWKLTRHTQRDFPLPDGHRLGFDIPVAIEHSDGTIHQVERGKVLG